MAAKRNYVVWGTVVGERHQPFAVVRRVKARSAIQAEDVFKEWVRRDHGCEVSWLAFATEKDFMARTLDVDAPRWRVGT